MNLFAVYSKTPKGIRKRNSVLGSLLSPMQSKVLALIDGKATIKMVLNKLDKVNIDDFERVINTLQQNGYIETAKVEPIEWLPTANFTPMIIEEFSSLDEVAAREQQAKLKETEQKEQQKAEAARARAETKVKADLEAERKAREAENARLKEEAERKAKQAAEQKARIEAEQRAKAEAERLAAEQKAREEAELKARQEAEARAKAEAEEQARLEAERLAREAEETARLEAERLAAEQKAREEADLKARQEAEARAEAEEQARLEAERKAREAEEARQREEAEEKARLEAERCAQEEAERLAAEQKAREEAELKARQEAEARAEADAKAKAAAEEKARLEIERITREAKEAKQREEAEKKAKKEAERLAAEQKAREEAELKALQEAEARAKTEAEEQARLEAERQAREAEEARQREEAERKAREEAERIAAEQKTKEEAEEKVRLEEAMARMNAEERARAEAEEMARREVERMAQELEAAKQKVETDKKAKKEAEKKAKEETKRLAAEQKAREKAEAKAKADTEKAQLEAENAAREADEAEKKRQAEEKALQAERLQALIRAEQRQEAAHLRKMDLERAERNALKEEVIVLDAAYDDYEDEDDEPAAVDSLMQEMAEDDGFVPTGMDAVDEALPEPTVDDEQRKLQALKQAAAAEREHRQRLTLLAKNWMLLRKLKHWLARPARVIKTTLHTASLLVLLLLLVALGMLPYVPLNALVEPAEQLAREQLGTEVKIRKVSAALLPRPHLMLKDMEIGTHGQRIGQVNAWLAIDSLKDEQKVMKALEIHDTKISHENFGQAEDWLNALGNSPRLKVESIRLSKVALSMHGLAMGEFEGEVVQSAAHQVQQIQLRSTDQKLQVQITPRGGNAEITLDAHDWALPLQNNIKFRKLVANGTAGSDKLQFSQIKAELYEGELAGQMTLGRSKQWDLTGNIRLDKANAAEVMQAFGSPIKVSGQLDAQAALDSHAADANQLTGNTSMSADFNIRHGEIDRLELSRLVLAKKGQSLAGEATRFDNLQGMLQISQQLYRLKNLALSSKQLNARGDMTIAADGEISGNFSASLAAQSRRYSADAAIGGRGSDIKLR